MITDHPDGMGVINEIIAGNEEMMKDETLKRWSDDLTSGERRRFPLHVSLSREGPLMNRLMNSGIKLAPMLSLIGLLSISASADS